MVSSYNSASTPLQQQQQQTPMTTDALIINSNSNIVSEEIILQLKEQFGENKQIFILNSSNNSISASTSSNLHASASSAAPIQYLIVDKDIDINTILQDPNIFNHVQTSLTSNANCIATNANVIANTNANTHMEQQQLIGTSSSLTASSPLNSHHNHAKAGSSSNNLNTNNINSNLIVEESINRVQVPPPKRKKFEFKLENKKNSYQDAFLRFLAGKNV